MKKILITIVISCLAANMTYGLVNIPAGNVSGTWTLANSPYRINGDITVATGTTLTINAGVKVEFMGPYRLTVSGKLIAIGTVSQMIQFTKTDTAGLSKKLTPLQGGTGRWNGIYFRFANTDTSRLDYCIVEYCNTYEGQSNLSEEESAITCFYSTLVVSNCLIKNNYGVNSGGVLADYGYIKLANNIIRNNTGYGRGGGIFTFTNQHKIITGNTIINNKGFNGGGIHVDQGGFNVVIKDNFISQNSATGGGGIYAVYDASAQILQNIIVNNTASYGGGISFENAGMVLMNNTICNNLATMGAGGLGFSNVTFLNAENNIIWGNKVNTTNNNIDIGTSNSKPAFTNCLIGGGIATISTYPSNAFLKNIITGNPMFVNPSGGAGRAYASVPTDWKLIVSSPCLNAGSETTFPDKIPSRDFFGQQRKHYEIIDIGVHEFAQSSVNVSGTINSPIQWISDTIKVTGNLTVNANLIIAPGVLVQYQGYYDITLNDTLAAIGTPANPIRFSIRDTTGFSNKSSTNGKYKGFTSSGVGGIAFRNCIFNYAERLNFNNCSNFIFENNLVEYCMAEYTFLSLKGANSLLRCNVFRNNDNKNGSYYKLIVLDDLNILFEGNRIYNNAVSVLENYSSNLRFFNNFIYNNSGGVLLERRGTYNNLYVNNTFAYNIGQVIKEGGTAKFINNIMYKNASPEYYSLDYVDEMYLSNNIFGNPVTPKSWETLIDNLVVDPQFIKPVAIQGRSAAVMNADYRIFSISPAIDKGILSVPGFAFPADDGTGNPRVNNGHIDIGAYEDNHKIPVVSVQPVGGSFCEGQNITISVSPYQADTMLYVWVKNGKEIPGETSRRLVLTNVNPDDFGNYACLLRNAYGLTESYPAPVYIKSKPSVLFHSDAQRLCQGQELMLEVLADGEFPLSFAWQRNSVTLPAYTLPRLKIASAVVSNSGTYRSIVSNECGKDTSENMVVNVYPLPVVNLGNDITLCANSKFVLDPGIFRTYLWNDYTTDRFKSPDTTGDYYVKVTDNNGCEGTSNTVTITIIEPYSNQQLCMVTVDSATQKNMIIWDDTKNKGIQSYIIYKLFGNKMVPIGSVPSGDLSVYIDYSSTPDAVSSRYAISVVDTCGNESDISYYHQTIHLGASAGIQPNTVVLDWTGYVDEADIFVPTFYKIYRGPSPDKLVLATSVSSAFTEWNDTNPGTNVYYQVRVDKPEPCDPANLLGRKTQSGPFVHSASNLEDNRLQGTSIMNFFKAGKVIIYPNPMSADCRIQWNNPASESYTLNIYDLKGTIIKQKSNIHASEYILKREDLGSGVYLIEIKGKDIFRGKLVVD